MRSRDLTDAVIEWIEADDAVSAFLGEDGGVTRIATARRVDYDPRVSVAASMSGSERENRQERKRFSVRVIVDASQTFVKQNEVDELEGLKDAVTDVITRHRPGWTNEGVGSDTEIGWNEPTNRHLGVVEVNIMRRDTRT